jgi:transcriptional regulator with XRE-family HTH domain
MPEVKLASTLAELIEQRGFRRNRRPILDAVHISSGALTQYITGKNYPSLPVLVDLADFFQVSLNYLVLGKERTGTETLDYGPLARYVDLSLARVQEQAARQTGLITRIARALSEQIRDVANSMAISAAPFAGVLYDNETLVLESYSIETKLLSMNLAYDIVVDPLTGRDAPGRFLPVVAANLDQGRTYQFMLPQTLNPDWPGVAQRFRALLGGLLRTDTGLANCQIRVTDAPVFVGIGLCRLDDRLLMAEEPILGEQLHGFLTDQGWYGYSIAPSEQLLADSIFDKAHSTNALTAFDALWKKAKAI